VSLSKVRYNAVGLRFVLSSTHEDTKTHISCGKSAIVVNRRVHELSQMWYNWQQKGMLIQNAFDLSPAEREFLQTGITPEEWDSTFKGPEE